MVDRQLNQVAIAEHNRLRALHGCPPLIYDENLAKDAQSWADNLCRMRMLKHSQPDGYGENLAYGTNIDGIKATHMWYDECKYHNYQGQFSSQSGHFTQLIWKSSKKVGFGVKRADNGRDVYIVARYQPPGNLFGEFRENVPQPTRGNIDGEINTYKRKSNADYANSRPVKVTYAPERGWPEDINEVHKRGNVKIIHAPERGRSEEVRDVSRRGDIKIIRVSDGERKNQNEFTVYKRKNRSQRKCAKGCSIM
ncbi:unnamed protein product [Trichobilharzia szidati]|nr:unnamed protein product [Trichobilharzia szidati]